MNSIKYAFLALLLSVSFASTSFAHEKEFEKEHEGEFNHHHGLSDSCWNVFLSQLSAEDSATVQSYLDSIAKNDTTIDSLRRLIPMTKGKGKAVKMLQAEIKALHKTNMALSKRIHAIIDANEELFEMVAEHCGQDTTEIGDTTNVGDTTGSPHDSLIVKRLAPNPITVNGTMNLTIELGTPLNVTVTISDLNGNLVKSFALGTLPSGSQTIPLDLTGIPPGNYLVMIQAGSSVSTWLILIL
jgi:hypothetical protein